MDCPKLWLDFLYYETPIGKVKRNQQFGREHVDIVARERSSGALVVIEVKKDDSDLDTAIVQGMGHVDWMPLVNGNDRVILVNREWYVGKRVVIIR